MPLYRRLPKRGFNSLKKNVTAIINISSIESLIKSKKLTKSPIDLKQLQEKRIINKRFKKLKVLGGGELKTKFDISTNFLSKQAKLKIEKIGGKINILKK